MAKWVLSPIAQEELTAILDYIAEQSCSFATTARVQDDFIDAFDMLAVNPHIGRIMTHLTGNTMRWWRVHRYLVVYDPDQSPLRILRIAQGARLLDTLFELGGSNEATDPDTDYLEESTSFRVLIPVRLVSLTDRSHPWNGSLAWRQS